MVKVEAARKWFKQAVHDLEMGKKNIEFGGYDVASFLAHQAVEKLLKAGFIMEGKSVPRKHFIDELARELNLPQDLQIKIADLIPDYALSRYPDVSEKVPYEEYTKEMAERKINIASSVLEYFKNRWGSL